MLIQDRCFGPFQSGWKLSPFCLNCSCCREPVKQRPSLPTICSLWVLTEPSTSPTGSTAGSLRATLSPSRSSQVLFRPFCTPTFSISITPSTHQSSRLLLSTDSLTFSQGLPRQEVQPACVGGPLYDRSQFYGFIWDAWTGVRDEPISLEHLQSHE